MYTIKSRGNSNYGTLIKANFQAPVNLLNIILPLKEGKLSLTSPLPHPSTLKYKESTLCSQNTNRCKVIELLLLVSSLNVMNATVKV